jgi:hypothetical protein
VISVQAIVLSLRIFANPKESQLTEITQLLFQSGSKIAQRYRLKALASEQFSRDATDRAIRAAWVEIAIEWHALSNRAAQEYHEGSVEAA